MKPVHLALALLVAALWGLTFVVISIGLRDFPPLLMASLRFVIAALPAFFLPRPPLSWPRLTAIGIALFGGHFGLLFTAMAVGMPAGLASVTLQSQAFFSILIAALVLGERPSHRQMTGSLTALTGLVVIGATAGTDGFTLTGLMLTIAGAFAWAIGNVLLRSSGKIDMLPGVVWFSVVPPLPLFALSLLIEGPHAIGTALTSVSWAGIASLAYIVIAATLIGFGIWGHLIKLYPVSTVAPFSLLVPVFGTLAAAVLLGEQFPPQRLAGMVLVVAGLAIVALPSRWLRFGFARG
jgi:O-acetylserine/cysteine efflux transporter